MSIGRRFTAFGNRYLLAEDVARRPGLSQRIETRAKLIGIVCLMIGVGFSRRIEVAAGAFVLSLVLAGLSRIRLREIGGVWVAIFAFCLLIGGASVFNIVTPGNRVLTILAAGRRLPEGLAITSSGIVVFSRLLMRMAAGATLAYLLYVTTGPRLLLGALGSLGVPNIFVVLLLMTHRYLFVLVRAAEEIGLAMTSRTIALSDGASGRKLTAFVIGSVFMRSKRLADDVHQAMLSRGFMGQIRFLKGPRPAFGDFSWIAACVVITGILIFFNG